MISIAICDDEAIQREALTNMLNEWLKHTSRTAQVQPFSNAEEVLASVQNGRRFDIYILDIMMPGIDGIKLGTMLRDAGVNSMIIYLTGSPDYAVDGYNVHAFHYLLKPVTVDKFRDIMDEAFRVLETKPTQGIQIKTKKGIVHLPFDDVLYAELSRRSVHYVTERGNVESTSIREPFADAVAPLLTDARFTLVGASFAVNLSAIRSVERGAAVLINGNRITLPASACSGLKTAWTAYWRENGTK